MLNIFYENINNSKVKNIHLILITDVNKLNNKNLLIKYINKDDYEKTL